jgi:hypothetical protein
MLVELQLVGVAAVPLNVTVLVLWDAPKLVPAIVRDVPTVPEFGLRLMIAGVTVKLTPLLTTPLIVTTTLPVVAPLGTGATIVLLTQLVGVAVVPLKVTVLVGNGPPKFVPETMTEVPIAPDVGFKLEMFGIGGVTVKFTPLLA